MSPSDEIHKFSFYDERQGDTYLVQFEPDGSFVICFRHVFEINTQPIVYEHLSDVPEPHQSHILSEISRLCQIIHRS